VSAVSQAKKENPDVILRDLGLPAGDGYVVMERLGNIESLALVPIIVLTAREEEFHKQRCRRERKRFSRSPSTTACFWPLLIRSLMDRSLCSHRRFETCEIPDRKTRE